MTVAAAVPRMAGQTVGLVEKEEGSGDARFPFHHTLMTRLGDLVHGRLL